MADPRYRVLVGLNYGPDGSIRREPGDIVDDLPPKSVKWLLEQGLVEPAEKAAAPAPASGGGEP